VYAFLGVVLCVIIAVFALLYTMRVIEPRNRQFFSQGRAITFREALTLNMEAYSDEIERYSALPVVDLGEEEVDRYQTRLNALRAEIDRIWRSEDFFEDPHEFKIYSVLLLLALIAVVAMATARLFIDIGGSQGLATRIFLLCWDLRFRL
jgi:hypothetical protein